MGNSRAFVTGTLSLLNLDLLDSPVQRQHVGMADASVFVPSPKSTVRRHADRAAYDRVTVHAVLDEALVAHVGFVHQGAPVVIPTAFVRVGEAIYLHGAQANRMLGALA